MYARHHCFSLHAVQGRHAGAKATSRQSSRKINSAVFSLRHMRVNAKPPLKTVENQTTGNLLYEE